MDHQQPSNGDSIQVVVRIKPGCQDDSVVYTHNEIKLDRHSFGFDRIFGPSAQQEDIFSAVGKKLLTHTLQGYNSCIFVYGQTGSGKTYTMMGNNNGMMQRSFNELFNRIDRMADSECIVTCSYFELYNEQIIDLLDRGKDKKTLNIRQDVKKGVFVENLTEESALNAEKLIDCLMTGMKNRHIGETQMNRQSSRSHSIFTISLAIKSEIDGKKVLKTPKLHFVDLAGSERQKMTMATGDRLKQAGNINKSLTTLGMVINALASDRPKVHIPYRDSKLTCLLRDSLGGNSKTFIVATITTSMLCFQQTLSTLNFANRAKMVKVKALVNEQSLSTNIQQYKEEIRRLKQEIQKFKSDRRVNFEHPVQETGISKTNSDLQHKFQMISNKIEDLRANMVNSSIESLYDRLQRNQQGAMLDENPTPTPSDAIAEQEGKEILQFMSCNNELLKKVQATMFQYLQLKQQIKNVEFSKRMPMQQMRTPSKFQRDQYQDLLIKRQNHIKQLQEKVLLLKEVNYKREIQIKENRKRLAMSEHHKMEEGEEMQRLRLDQEEQEKRLGEIQLKYEMAEDEISALKAQITQLETRLKQSKQLYLYSQQKYENERFIRGKLETSFKDLSKKLQHLQTERRQSTEQLTSKIELLQQKIIEGERRQEDLKSEQEILNESLEFSQRRLKQYGDRLQKANRQIGESSAENKRLSEAIVWGEADAERKRREYEGIVVQLTKSIQELREDKDNLIASLGEVRKEREELLLAIQEMKEQHRYEICQLSQQISQLELQKRLLQREMNELQSLHQSTILDYNTKVESLSRTIQTLQEEVTAFQRWKIDMQERYQAQRLTWESQKTKVMTDIQSVQAQHETMRKQLNQKHTKMLELQAFVSSNRNIIDDHQQLKRSYKEIIKQNYRLKGQYHNTNQATRNEELESKVAFYQQKFRLMSIQYNKVQETTKKLKQKEYSLMKKIQYYQQHEKLKKIHSSSQAQEVKSQNIKSLMLQNQELKLSLAKTKTMYESLVTNDKKEDYTKRLSIENQRYQLEQREEKIKKRLESAIKNWDHAKENNCTGMALDELFNCWTKIELESRKKFQGIVKAIKRQQKLKSQNHFILKENIFLKSQVQALEKELNMQALGNPRKLAKPNEEMAQQLE